ncbi:apoptosis facilitator Bcl-2-like protein 14 isoform X2 [Amblyraja radiata]|uniref:apoptosis facilitator Bcl-2-like protein 14 isoform X2 n=1 Tax=Amblyraja radiata TaxID=386614 RepID=UPI001403EE0B|nr:apoptosis facilitator Bcl-2-like protein 14 isoform X2 [Amblyraja radiata]
MGSADAAESNSASGHSTAEDDSFEYRVLMAYAERTLLVDKLTPPKTGDRRTEPPSGGRRSEGPLPQLESATHHSKGSTKHRAHRRRFKWKRVFPRCLRAQASSDREPEDGVGGGDDIARSQSIEIVVPEAECVSETDPQEIAEMLQDVMSTNVSFRMLHSTNVEVDGPDDQKTIDRIVEFLTTKGDSIDEEIKKDPQFGKLFGEKPSLSFFKKIMDYVRQTTLPADAESEGKATLKQFAFIVHATTKFAVSANFPMARVMGYGGVYLRENFSNWVKEEGGWDKIMIMEEQHVD